MTASDPVITNQTHPRLALIRPSGEEEPMTPLGGGVFRVGDDDRSPERIRFDAVLNGQALRANLSRGDYQRSFTR